MTSDTPKNVSAIPLRASRRCVTMVLFIVALTSSLAAVVYHLHADPLSAEEQRLVGTWRRFDADGKHIRDERYFPDRSTERRCPTGDDDAGISPWRIVIPLKRWMFSNGQIHVRRRVSFDERADTWMGGRYVHIGNFTFPKTSARRRFACVNSLKRIGLALSSYSAAPVSLPQAVIGETILMTSDEFPGEVHTLRRLVSAKLSDSQIGWPSDD